MPHKPLIIVCGTTGVGKSKLAVELALRQNGRVINADAMQVYKGLDILTNKILFEERQGVEHTLIGFKDPGDQYVVGDWIKDVTREIEVAYADGKLPIVVGGTAYWIHHLLFPQYLPTNTEHRKSTIALPSTALSESLDQLPPELLTLFNNLPETTISAKESPEEAFKLYELLNRLDPEMARRWHWKDTRKVRRNIEIIKENGVPASQAVRNAYKNAAVRPYDVLLFWLYADRDVINQRLDERVDEMIQQGLIAEVRHLMDHSGGKQDLTCGIYQAIGRLCGILRGLGFLTQRTGFKEFESYLKLEKAENDTFAFDKAKSEMKQSTRKYAQRQIKWIKNKLIPSIAEYKTTQISRTTEAFVLDATDIRCWENDVLQVANMITKAFLTSQSLPDPPSISTRARDLLDKKGGSTNPEDVFILRRKIICPVCTVEPRQPVMLEEGKEWEAHQRTKLHKYMSRRTYRQTEEKSTSI